MGEGNGMRQQLEGRWDQFRGRIKEAWGVLTDQDLERLEGKWDRVVGMIKEKTGETVETIERKLKDLVGAGSGSTRS
jgi:uncharacterized protein YjbJ (UPF0337 family)